MAKRKKIKPKNDKTLLTVLLLSAALLGAFFLYITL